MFQSHKYTEYITSRDGKYFSKYELTDSEFGTVFGEIAVEVWGGNMQFFDTVIQEYSKRNLNVAANLIRAFVWYNKLHPYWSIQQLIDHNKRRNPLFLPHEKDLQKYLVLL
jgi:hypothetical protein